MNLNHYGALLAAWKQDAIAILLLLLDGEVLGGCLVTKILLLISKHQLSKTWTRGIAQDELF